MSTTVTLFCLPRRRRSRTSCSTFKMLQHVWLLTGTWKYERCLSRLMHDDLHWLVIPQRVQYNLSVTVHRCLRQRAPRYLADYCVPVSEVAGRQHLRCHQLSVPRVRRSTFGTRAFSVAEPRVWNSLPDHLRDPAVDPEQFRRDLKTYLFAGHSKRWRISGVT